HRLTSVIDKLVIYPDNMLKNMNKFRGLVMSQRVLLALTQAGASRDDAYKLVQRNAMRVWNENKDFYSELISDKDVRSFLTEEDIKDKFDLGYHTKHVNTIFKRVFGE
ncbi:MAG: adenylosuccinate lyase, partial [Paracoccaceae bacterium]